jgi:hypothetical protein
MNDFLLRGTIDQSYRNTNLRYGFYHLCMYFNFSVLLVFTNLISPKANQILNNNLAWNLTKLGQKEVGYVQYI